MRNVITYFAVLFAVCLMLCGADEAPKSGDDSSVRVKRQWGPWDYYGYDTYRPRGYWGRRWRRRFRWRSQFYDPYGWRK
uniref:Uncharacterized protein n=1 Tax=Ascaris lumbricoides TaxID=6252 RepID=A0A0M3IBB4_ASCLU